MKKHESDLEHVMCMEHHNFGGMVIGYHDNAEASNTDMAWADGGSICILEMKTCYPTLKRILTKTKEVLRDPCISFDGKKVLYAQSGSGKGSGYKIWEMEIDNPASAKALTTDPGVGKAVADFEPCYLPNGDIMFTSTRNFGFNPDGVNPTTNMFLMNGEGKFLRQVGFDQAHTFYPVVMNDGSVLYSRWEFNDRTNVKCMGLFTMNPDGSHQTEYFGNQTSWPFTMLQARPIQNSDKVIAIAGGLHGPYCGEMMIIDRIKGTNGAQSIKMIAPVRETAPDANSSGRDIALGGVYYKFQTPYGLDENSFLVSWRKDEGSIISNTNTFNLYLMDTTGSRELLVVGTQSISQPIIVKPRTRPALFAKQANYHDSLAEFTLQNVYYGAGMEGIVKGTAKTLRVIKLHYRVQGGTIGTVMGSAPAGSFAPAIFCPVSQFAMSWDGKEVLGETPIYEDGSASFKVPARSPVYFQVIDSNGYCIATMRSWSTLQPGEKFPCLGCHENKLESPPGLGQIPKAGNPKSLEKPLGIEDTPFDYPKMVQPIFDKHCTSCHNSPSHESGFNFSGDLTGKVGSRKAPLSYSSLLKGISAVTSNKALNINTIFSPPEQQKPYSFGACKSNIMIEVLKGTSHKDKIKTDVTDKEKRIIACWIDLCAPLCGSFAAYLTPSDSAAFMKQLSYKENWMQIESDNIKKMIITASIPDNYNPGKSIQLQSEQLRMRYIPKLRTLTIDNPGQGDFLLVDLRGRVISQTKILNQYKGAIHSISLPATLNTGIYVARFEGSNKIQHLKFSITK
jgi:hypothetical protein